jgi:hypothetical protein
MRNCGYTTVVRHTEKAHAQTAHLVFAHTKTRPEKPKELFLCQRLKLNKNAGRN